ncbi:MAG: TadE/TadG family type IV pilus assembly protein [Actinomycetota bacterium]|nr:pilus assembly protein [Actinomycetota bacterium]
MDNKPRLETGQATVEFALTLPFMIIFSLCVVQIGSVANDQLALNHAARVAAREISLADVDDSLAQQVAIESIRREIDLEDLEVITQLSPKMVTVDLKFRRRVEVPLIGVVAPAIELNATATMPREPSTN